MSSGLRTFRSWLKSNDFRPVSLTTAAPTACARHAATRSRVPEAWRSMTASPRQREDNPRCYSCKSGPMWHLAHRWGPCQVQVLGSDEPCGCVAGVMSERP